MVEARSAMVVRGKLTITDPEWKSSVMDFEACPFQELASGNRISVRKAMKHERGLMKKCAGTDLQRIDAMRDERYRHLNIRPLDEEFSRKPPLMPE